MGKNCSLLLIESDATLAQRWLCVLAAEQTGWSIQMAHTVSQSRVLLAQHAFDVVLLSDVLPDGRGFDLAHELADTPVILCVNEGDEAVAAQGMRLGFFDYFIKDSRNGYFLTLPLQVAAAHQRRTAMRELAQQQQRLSFATEGLGMAVWDRVAGLSMDGVDVRWLAWLGYSRAEATASDLDWRDLIHPDDAPRVAQANADYMEGRTSRYECEYRMLRKSGDWIWGLSRGHAVERDANGRPTRLIGTFMDLTERKAQEHALARQHELLQVISRTQAKFIGNVGASEAFEGVLADLLKLTDSGYGFVAEVLFNAQQQPYIRTHAITDISWDEPSRALFARSARGELEFHNLKTLFGEALLTEKPVIVNDPAHDPRRGGLPPGHPALLSFLGIPIHRGETLVAMVGLANCPGGYSEADVAYLQPLCSTIGQLVHAQRNETERRQAVAALHTTLDSISQGLCMVDPGGSISVYNRRWQELLELPDTLLAGVVSHAAVVHFQAQRGDFGPMNEFVELHARPHIAKGGWQHTPERYRRRTRDGRVLEVISRLLPSGGLVRTFTDITQSMAAHDELLQTRELMTQKAQELRIALDNMVQGILTLDADGRITLYNKRFLELLELPESRVAIGLSGAELVRYQLARGDFGNDFELVEADGRPHLQAGVLGDAPERFLRKTPSGCTLEVKTRPLPDGGIVRTFSDVTHFVEAQKALLASEARFRSLTELSSDWYWEQDEQFRFVRIDGSLEVVNGMTSESLLGLRRWETSPLGVSESAWAAHRQMLMEHKTFRNFEMQRVGQDGRMNWVLVSGVPIFGNQGEFLGYRGVGRNITEQKRAEDETERLAFYDTLTGLPNRRLLLDRLAVALLNSARNRSHGALLFIDLDNFKDLNDTLGHDIGDLLLEKVANRLAASVRQGDTVARLGGDEFVVMLENLSADGEQASAQTRGVGDKILATLNQAYDLPGRVHYSTPSMGVTLFWGREHGVDELLKRADLAMYQAKAAGRNTLRFFDPDMQAAVANRAALEIDLRHGLQVGELLLHYQGVVNAQGMLVGAEALARWQHPKRGMVSPMEFIGLAEQTGLILPLGAWVLRAACEQLVRWAAQPAMAHLTLAVNVSARQFRQSDFVESVLQTLAHTGARADRLKLELTESMLLHDVEDIIAKMAALKERGVGFSLDDFGTGYSSLSYLKRLPLDQLKIDKSFVRDVLTDPDDAAIARAVITLAHSLGLSVVAEGVEQVGQLKFLIEHGCQTFQGYLFGKPAPTVQLPTATEFYI